MLRADVESLAHFLRTADVMRERIEIAHGVQIDRRCGRPGPQDRMRVRKIGIADLMDAIRSVRGRIGEAA